MAFKLGNTTVIHDSDATAAVESTSDLDILKINGTDVLVHDGTTITLKNVDINDAIEGSINSDNITEGSTNQFYTTSLFDIDFATKTTSDLLEGTNLYYTDARVDAYVNASMDTDDLNEGTTNLYFTDARAQAATDGQQVKFKNVYATIGDLPSATDYHGMFAHVHAEGKGYFAHGGNWVPLANETLTDTLITNSNRIAHADSGVVSHLNFTTNQFGVNNQTVLSSVKSINFFLDSNGGDSTCAFRIYNDIDPDNLGATAETDHIFKVAETGDVSVGNDLTVAGDTIITGDLTVSGTTTTINTNELNIGDNIITLNSDETGAPSQNAGIEVERGTSDNVGIRWNETSDAWEFTNDGTSYTALGTSSTFTGDTDGVSEGSTNLYYTDARVQTYIGGDRTHGNITADSITGTGALSIKSGNQYVYIRGDNNGNMFAGKTSEWAAMYYNDSIKVQTTNTGADITGDLNISGDVIASGDVTAYSDERLKRNIETIQNPIDIVNCLRGVSFEKDGRSSIGVIAQETEDFLPEVVHTDNEGMKSVAYGNITGLLIEAIKDQQKTIEELQKQISDLQNK